MRIFLVLCLLTCSLALPGQNRTDGYWEGEMDWEGKTYTVKLTLKAVDSTANKYWYFYKVLKGSLVLESDSERLFFPIVGSLEDDQSLQVFEPKTEETKPGDCLWTASLALFSKKKKGDLLFGYLEKKTRSHSRPCGGSQIRLYAKKIGA